MTTRWFAPLLRAAAFALALAFAGSFAAQAQTQPPAGEKELLEYLKKCPAGQVCTGRVSIPDARSSVLESPAGRPFADRMEGTVKRYGGWFLLVVVALLAIFYFVRGRIRIDAGESGRKVERFTGFERFVHWSMASSFIVLGLTGLNVRFGRSVVMPLIGEDGFAWLSTWGKILHNYVAFAFMASLILTALIWIAHNMPAAGDMRWLKAGGGILKKGEHPPARKFNAGQKLIFWAVILGGAAISVTGINMLFEAGTADKSWLATNIWLHSVIAIVLIGVILAHIYIGSIGMQGAFDAMGTGKVDENWAKEHHSLWLDEMKKKRPGGAPAE